MTASERALALTRSAALAAEDIKAEQIVALDVSAHMPLADVFLIASGTNERQVVAIVREAGWAPGNIDASVIAEAPKIGPHAAAMRLEIREATGLPIEAISVKATTNERMGFVGREEGIAAMAVATIVPVESRES